MKIPTASRRTMKQQGWGSRVAEQLNPRTGRPPARWRQPAGEFVRGSVDSNCHESSIPVVLTGLQQHAAPAASDNAGGWLESCTQQRQSGGGLQGLPATAVWGSSSFRTRQIILSGSTTFHLRRWQAACRATPQSAAGANGDDHCSSSGDVTIDESDDTRRNTATKADLLSRSIAAGSRLPAAAVGDRPLNPAALYSLYAMYFCACFVERTWRFGLPLVLAFVPGGFQAIAILGFVAPLACSLAGPAVGRMLDSVYRPLGLGAMLVAQDLSILLSCVALALTAVSPDVPLMSNPLFGVMVVLAMCEKLASISSELAIERDWVTQLAGKQNVLALARSNAYLRRTDLFTELVGALVFGWIYSRGGLATSMAFTAVLAAAAVPLQLFFIRRIAELAPGAMLHGRQEPGAGWVRLPTWRSFVENARLRKLHAAEAAAKRQPLFVRARAQVAHALDGWRSYFCQPILPSSLTFVLLFFNVVLSPGGLITAFLTLWGFDGNAMALFRGGCAACGFLGTLVGKRLIQTLGLLRAGTTALLIQASLLSVATALFSTLLSGPPELGPGGGMPQLLLDAGAASWPVVGGVALPVVVFAALVVMSRVGMWAYDMVNSQLFQQTVAPREIASASSAEMALCSFSELLMLGIAAVSADAQSFPLLVYASFSAVVAANLLFRTWSRRAQPSVDIAIANAAAT